MDNPTKATIKIQPDLNKIKAIIDDLLKIDEITDIWHLWEIVDYSLESKFLQLKIWIP